MLKAEKIERLEVIKSQLEGVSSMFLLSFSKVNVPDITQFRQDMKQEDANYMVVKNRLFKRAITDTEYAVLEPHLAGSTAVVFSRGDAIQPAKKIVEFHKTHPEFEFKAGYVEGQVLEPAQLIELSRMPGKEELISKMLFLLQSPMRRLVTALNSPLQNVATVLKAVADKK